MKVWVDYWYVFNDHDLRRAWHDGIGYFFIHGHLYEQTEETFDEWYSGFKNKSNIIEVFLDKITVEAIDKALPVEFLL